MEGILPKKINFTVKRQLRELYHAPVCAKPSFFSNLPRRYEDKMNPVFYHKGHKDHEGNEGLSRQDDGSGQLHQNLRGRF